MYFDAQQKEKSENAKRERNRALKMQHDQAEKDNKLNQNDEENKEDVDNGNAISLKENLIQNTKNTKKKATDFWEKHKIYALGWIIIGFVVVGTLVMVYVEGQDGASAFEWNFVTLSTVGYGDVTPQTKGGKVFVIFYIIFGVFLMGYFGTAVFEKYGQIQDQKFKDQILARALISEAQLLEFDVDGNNKIDKYEFLSKMLIETQEIDQGKIDQIMKTFDMLDVDGNGRITTDELKEIENAKYERWNVHKQDDEYL